MREKNSELHIKIALYSLFEYTLLRIQYGSTVCIVFALISKLLKYNFLKLFQILKFLKNQKLSYYIFYFNLV